MSCPSVKTKCKNSRLVLSVQRLIKQLESQDITNFIPITQKDLYLTKRALSIYLRECNICASQASNDYQCLRAALENLKRRIPMFSKNIYPWRNYDWNYGNFVSNNYNTKYTGATSRGSIRSLYKNVIAINKILNGLTTDPIPNYRSVSGLINRNSDYPPFEQCNNIKCYTTQRIKNALAKDIYKPPTTDNFLKKKLHGEYSSSYFVKVGSCPRHDIKTQSACQNRGYTWTPNIANTKTGSCHQPRYLFINNKPKAFMNGSKMKGMIPSLADTILSLTPDKILAAAMGNSMSDYFTLQQCPTVKETFQINNIADNCKLSTAVFWIVLLIIIYTYHTHLN